MKQTITVSSKCRNCVDHLDDKKQRSQLTMVINITFILAVLIPSMYGSLLWFLRLYRYRLPILLIVKDKSKDIRILVTRFGYSI